MVMMPSKSSCWPSLVDSVRRRAWLVCSLIGESLLGLEQVGLQSENEVRDELEQVCHDIGHLLWEERK